MLKIATVVIPCADPRFLREAIESALGQSYPRVEVVVVDDGSANGWLTELICHEFGIRMLRTASRLGEAGARNTAIAATEGDYVMPLDDDDIMDRDYVARAVAVLEREPAAGVVYCKLQAFGNASFTWEPAPGWTLRELIASPRVPSPSLYRRRCWEQAGGYTDGMVIGADWDLWIRIAGHGWRFLRIPEYLVFYRRHEANATVVYGHRYAASAARIAERYAAAAADEPIAADVEFSITASPSPSSSSTPPGPSSRTTP